MRYNLICKDLKNPATERNATRIVGADETTNGAGVSTLSGNEHMKIGAKVRLIDPSVNLNGLDVEIKTACYRFQSVNAGLVEDYGIKADNVHKESERVSLRTF